MLNLEILSHKKTLPTTRIRISSWISNRRCAAPRTQDHLVFNKFQFVTDCLVIGLCFANALGKPRNKIVLYVIERWTPRSERTSPRGANWWQTNGTRAICVHFARCLDAVLTKVVQLTTRRARSPALPSPPARANVVQTE